MHHWQPTAALVELKGALRYHGTDARHFGEVLRIRAITHLGVDIRVGIGPTATVAATASAQITEPGGALAIDPDQAADRLAALPVKALHGIGPRQATVLPDYSIHTVGLLAAVSPVTAQRLLGGRATTGKKAADGLNPAAPQASPVRMQKPPTPDPQPAAEPADSLADAWNSTATTPAHGPAPAPAATPSPTSGASSPQSPT